MSRRHDNERQLADAMQSLVQNDNFRVFMEYLRLVAREEAVAYMVDHTTVKDQRESLAAVGEVRCYDSIWSVYEAHKNAVAHGIPVTTNNG